MCAMLCQCNTVQAAIGQCVIIGPVGTFRGKTFGTAAFVKARRIVKGTEEIASCADKRNTKRFAATDCIRNICFVRSFV